MSRLTTTIRLIFKLTMETTEMNNEYDGATSLGKALGALCGFSGKNPAGVSKHIEIAREALTDIPNGNLLPT